MIQTINIAAIIIFTAYVIYVRVVLEKFPKSLSQSFYDIQEKTGNMNLLFLLMLATSATTLLVNGYAHYEFDENVPLLAYGGLGIFAVGVFAIFKNKKVTVFHYIGAVIGFGVSLLSFGFDYSRWELTVASIIIGGCATVIAKKGTKIFWLEVSLAYCLILSLFVV